MGLFRRYITYKCIIAEDTCLILPIIVKNKKGEEYVLNFLVDTGAARSMIRGDLVKDLKLDIERYKRKTKAFGIGGESNTTMTYFVRGYVGSEEKTICFPASGTPQSSDMYVAMGFAGLIGYDLMRGGKIDLKRGILKIRIDNVINCGRDPYWVLGWGVSQRYGFAPLRKFGLIPEYELTEEEKAELVEYDG